MREGRVREEKVPNIKQREITRKLRILHISTSFSEFEIGSRGTVRGKSRLVSKTLPVAAHGVRTMVASSFDVDVHFVLGYNVSESNSELINGTITRAGAQRVTWTEFVFPFVPNRRKPGEMERLDAALSLEHRYVVLKRMNDGYDFFSCWEDDIVVTGAHVRYFIEKSLLLESVEKSMAWRVMMMPGFTRVEVATESSKERLFGMEDGASVAGSACLKPPPAPPVGDACDRLLSIEVLNRQSVPSTCHRHPPGLSQAIDPDICCSINDNRSISNIVLWEAALASFQLVQLPTPVAQVVGLLPVASAKQSLFKPSHDFPNLSKRHSNSLFSQQAGWMASAQQLRRLIDRCTGKFLPPFDFDSTFKKPEFWSGGFQLFGGRFCRVQRVVFLGGADFSHHLIYHFSDNKQSTRPPFHFLRAADLQAQLAQRICAINASYIYTTQ